MREYRHRGCQWVRCSCRSTQAPNPAMHGQQGVTHEKLHLLLLPSKPPVDATGNTGKSAAPSAARPLHRTKRNSSSSNKMRSRAALRQLSRGSDTLHD
jgi:hypothetical protein